MDTQGVFWVGFIVFVFVMLAMDLGVFNKKAHEIKTKEALIWSGIWIGLAGVFSGLVAHWFGGEKALQFVTAYVMEKSLSVDNLFVFIMIFSYFKIGKLYQHKILFWGILGALVMRAVMIAVGIQILEAFHFVIYIFGAFLIVTAIKMLFESKEEIEFERKLIVRLLKKIMPISKEMDGGKFLTMQNAKRAATPMLVALLMIEFTDLVFALDSIPAVLAISHDMFIVYTSNIFAILGLRSLYFALAGMMGNFVYLKYGLSAVLAFVGTKMLISGYYHVDILVSLGVIVGCLTLSILASVLFPSKDHKHISDLVK
ncbi:TerC family protein [Candidatus Gracilibacteria bacterium]|nr:TerC family protein [Candidatus Gracilibacteria bacterium]